jgi:serine/threonine protein kinase
LKHWTILKKGVSHLDIKPENIICSSDFQIKLIDFGFASSETCLLNLYCGSIHYCAPEILNYTPYYGKFADIWSCGVILFALLTGMFPFWGKTEYDTIKAIKKCQYSIPITISEFASKLIKALLNINPQKRILPTDILKHEWFENSVEFIDFNNNFLG